MANSARAKGSGTKCEASGMVTSAEPKPVMPKISAPEKAMSASSAASWREKGSRSYSGTIRSSVALKEFIPFSLET